MRKCIISFFLILIVHFSSLEIVGQEKVSARRNNNSNQINNSAKEKKTASRKKIEKQKYFNDLSLTLFKTGRLENKYHVLVGGGLSTDGYKTFIEYGRRAKNNKSVVNLFSMDLVSERINPKQTKVATFESQFTRTVYVYRKQNIFHLLKFSYGREYRIGNIFQKKAVSINAYFKSGLSLALLRPYYLEILVSNPSSGETETELIKYTPETADNFLNQSIIYTSGGISHGWNELDVVPGFHVEAGARIYFLPRLKIKSLLGVECSLLLDLYSQEIAIMIPSPTTPAQRFFVGGAIAILLGGRG